MFKIIEGKYGDSIHFKGNELSRKEVLNILNNSMTVNTKDGIKERLIKEINIIKEENNIKLKKSNKREDLIYHKGIDLGIDRIRSKINNI